jgi:hypothetical protein
MNKLIQSILEKCYDPDYGFVDQEKFAELIVRECAMFVVTELEGKVGSRIADATVNRLERHFGIEK